MLRIDKAILDVDGVICEDGLSKEIQDKLETYQTKII